MSEQPTPQPGSIVTIANPHGPRHLPLTRAVVAGPVVNDPFTGVQWVLVRLSQHVDTVVNLQDLVDVTTPVSRWYRTSRR